MFFWLFVGDESSNFTISHGSVLEDMLAEKLDKQKDKDEQNKLSSKVLVMEPILRFLQLLCENHNRDLQVKRAGANLLVYHTIPVINDGFSRVEFAQKPKQQK